MSLTTNITIWCDRCHTSEQFPSNWSAKKARAQLKGRGWLRSRDDASGKLIDVCPKCTDTQGTP